MNADIVYNHILSHKSKDAEHMCDICNMIFNDSGQLSDHISKAHTLHCIVCNSSAFPSRQSLTDHSKLCQSADLNEKAGIISNMGVCNDASPISLLIKALSKSKLASFHLEGEAEREAFRHRNVREQFSRNVLKKFAKIIKQKEITSGVVYSPLDLLKTYLIFEQTELSDSKYIYSGS